MDPLVCPKESGNSPTTNPMTWGPMGVVDHQSGQFITTFPAGWSPQMVVIVRESPPKWP